MKPRKSKSQQGWLEIFFYVAVLIVVGDAFMEDGEESPTDRADQWTINIAVALVMLVAVYAVLRDVRALRQLNARSETAPSSDALVPLQRSSQGSRVLQQPHPVSSLHHGSRKAEDQTGRARRTTQPMNIGRDDA
jgi:ABC-type nickel/cobalt efflux system permease component RcnA